VISGEVSEYESMGVWECSILHTPIRPYPLQPPANIPPNTPTAACAARPPWLMAFFCMPRQQLQCLRSKKQAQQRPLLFEQIALFLNQCRLLN